MNIKEELNKQGFKIRRIHYRRLRGVDGEFKDFAIRELKLGKQIEPRGGKTVVRLTTSGGAKTEATAFCCESDCYNRKEGVKLALRRATENLYDMGLKRPDLSFLE